MPIGGDKMDKIVQRLSLKGEDKKIPYQQPIDRTYVVELEKRKKGNKISILSDSMFKTMFYNENRMKYACKFLSYFLDISYEELLHNLKLGKNELDKKKETSKGERSDYVAEFGDVCINIEVNCNDSVETMERNMDYAYRLYSIKVKVGNDYHYSQVIQFGINNFAFKGNDKIIDTYYIQNDEGILLNDKLTFIQIYVPNLIKKWYTSGIESLTEVERFILTLVEQELDKAKELGKGDSIIEEYIQLNSKYRFLLSEINQNIFQKMNITESMEIFAVTYYMILNGFLSINHEFYDKTPIDYCKFTLGTSIMSGSGICRNLAPFLTDLIKECNYESYNVRMALHNQQLYLLSDDDYNSYIEENEEVYSDKDGKIFLKNFLQKFSIKCGDFFIHFNGFI